MFIKSVLWWSGRTWPSSCYHKLQRDIICFRDTGPSNSQAITLRAERSGSKGGRNEPAGSAYRIARNPGTAEETSSASLRSQESSAERGGQRSGIGVLFYSFFYQESFKKMLSRDTEVTRLQWIRIFFKENSSHFFKTFTHQSVTQPVMPHCYLLVICPFSPGRFWLSLHLLLGCQRTFF